MDYNMSESHGIVIVWHCLPASPLRARTRTC